MIISCRLLQSSPAVTLLWAFLWILSITTTKPASALLVVVAPQQSQSSSPRTFFATRTSTSLCMAGKKGSTPEPVQNEMSRTLSTESIFHTAGGKRRQAKREYKMQVDASEEECKKLAERFGLPHISALSASVTIQRPSQEMGGSTSYANGLSACQVDGSIEATVTQVCVRTSEQFTSDVNIPLKALVIPISPAQSNQNDNDDVNAYDDEKLFRDLQQNANLMDTKRLRNTQDILELSKLVDEAAKDSGDHVIVEDESIYSAQSGEFDVGELVSQTFWLGLDPYPKRPGTDPVQYSISG